jgi:hypothetical protein
MRLTKQMSTNKDRIEFAMFMGRFTNSMLHDIQQVMRNAKTHALLCETMCNRELTAKEQAKLKRLEDGFQLWAKRTGCTGVITARDPRGCTVKLRVKCGFTNDFAQEGICVPQ